MIFKYLFDRVQTTSKYLFFGSYLIWFFFNHLNRGVSFVSITIPRALFEGLRDSQYNYDPDQVAKECQFSKGKNLKLKKGEKNISLLS